MTNFIKNLIRKLRDRRFISGTVDYMRVAIDIPVNINLGRNIFMNGYEQFNTGSSFTFNVETGTYYCNRTGIYTWNFNTMLIAGSANKTRNNLIITNGIIYNDVIWTPYASKVVKQFSFTVTLPAQQGEVWALGCIEIDGIAYTSGIDEKFGCPTTTLEIIAN